MHATASSSLDQLVTGSAARDLEREFEERLADSGPLAFRVAYGVLRHREDAEDVAQEALAKAYVKLNSLRGRHSFRAWLVRICWRLALDRRRSSKRRERREQAALQPLVVDGEQVVAADALLARLWRAIDALPEDLRMVVVLAGIEGYDSRELAALLEVPEGTAKSRLYRARKRLTEMLR